MTIVMISVLGARNRLWLVDLVYLECTSCSNNG